MSVTFQTIVLYGWEIGTAQYEEYDEKDGWENTLDQTYGWRDASDGDVACIYDGRSGEYCFFGVVVSSTNSTRGGPQSFDEPISIGNNVDAGSKNELYNAVTEHGIDIDGMPQYHVFTHVT